MNSIDSSSRVEWHQQLISSWISHNPLGHGTGWEPYPCSLRIVNWCKWHYAGNKLTPLQLHNLAMQIRWLENRIEWHLLGNHLFANAKALVYAGLFFHGQEADKWLKTGLGIIERQLPEQVLSDGGNFELSPMYHSIFLGDVLDLVNIAGLYPERVSLDVVNVWRDTAKKMLYWLSYMTHPDGEISFFNDAAFGVASSPTELHSYAARLGIVNSVDERICESSVSVMHLADSGYVRICTGPVAAILDVAAVGPDYIPGHAHADTLSFELSIAGHRVFVNGGTSVYGNGRERLRERGTAAHSTVVIDEVDSSEVWGGFRVARRAYPFGFRIEKDAEQVSVSCAHNGYMRLAGKPVHHREWRFSRRSLIVSDSIPAGRVKSAVARYLLHPSIMVKVVSESNLQLILPNNDALRFSVSGGTFRLEQSLYSPEFGVAVDTICIVVPLNDRTARTEFVWG